MSDLEEEGNAWTLLWSTALHLLTSYLPRVSCAVCASDRNVRAMAELNGPVQERRVEVTNSEGLYRFNLGKSTVKLNMPSHVVHFQYDEAHRAYAECIVDARDVEAVERVVWWLQVVGVRSLCLKGTNDLYDTGVQRVLSALLTEKALTHAGRALPFALEELTCETYVGVDNALNISNLLQRCECLRRIQLRGYILESLDGFEKLTSLEVLLMTGIKASSLGSLEPLGRCRRLHQLSWGSCTDFRSLKVLDELKELSELHLRNTMVHDLTPLRKCAGIRKLKLRQCPNLRSLHGVERLRSLMELTLFKTDVHDLAPLRGCARLERLTLDHCSELHSLDGLEQIPRLTELNLLHANVDDLAPLRRCVGLEKLTLGHCCELRSLDGLAQIPSLTELCLFWMTVDDLTPLRESARLAVLVLQGCRHLRSLAGVENLAELQCITLSEDMRGVDVGAVPPSREHIVKYVCNEYEPQNFTFKKAFKKVLPFLF